MTIGLATHTVDDQIRDIVNRETRAWDTQDAELLVPAFTPPWSGPGRPLRSHTIP